MPVGEGAPVNRNGERNQSAFVLEIGRGWGKEIDKLSFFWICQIPKFFKFKYLNKK